MSDLEEFSRALREFGRTLIEPPMLLIERFLNWLSSRLNR